MVCIEVWAWATLATARMPRVMRRGRRWKFMLKCVNNRCIYNKNKASGFNAQKRGDGLQAIPPFGWSFQDVFKLPEQSNHLPPDATPIRLDESFRQCKKNPGLTGRDFPSFPLAFAARGQDSRIQHSLAPLTRHPGRNEQKSRYVARCCCGRHSHWCWPDSGSTRGSHWARNSTSIRCTQRLRSHCRSGSRRANL